MRSTGLERARRAVSRIAWVRALLLIALVCIVAGPQAARAAEQMLAPLTGRVVDDANLLSAASATALERKLRGLEDKSGIQLVVATVKSLGGEEIEPYANRLFRVSKLGDQKKNNGALLLVAPAEHKARIEVGYGLEGTLTDALSKLIITNAMIPRFKSGDFQGGIERGVDDIIAVLSTDQADWSKREDLQPQTDSGGGEIIIVLMVIGVIVVVALMSRRRGGRRGGMIFAPTPSSNWSPDTSSGSGSSGSSDDNSLSGGGGSSGGGGASGSW